MLKSSVVSIKLCQQRMKSTERKEKQNQLLVTENQPVLTAKNRSSVKAEN